MHSIECITHAGHSIAFLHFLTRDLNFDLINWWARTRDRLSLWQVWFWFCRADKHTQTDTHRHTTPLDALLPRLSSASSNKPSTTFSNKKTRNANKEIYFNSIRSKYIEVYMRKRKFNYWM